MSNPDERLSPLFPKIPRAAELPEQVPVQYIGRKPEYRDRHYGTGLTFAQGQVRIVPKEGARRLLRHGDLFVVPAGKAKPDEAKDDTQTQLDRAQKEQDKKDEAQNRLQDLYDQVNFVMDKDALELFARANYRHELDKRRSLDKLRSEVVALIDQYGIA